MSNFFNKIKSSIPSSIPTLNKEHVASANELTSTGVSLAKAASATLLPLLHITQGATAILLVAAPPVGAAIVCLAALTLKAYDLFKDNEELAEMLDEITFYVVEIHEYAEKIKVFYTGSTKKNEYMYLLEHMVRLSVTIQLLINHQEKSIMKSVIVFTPKFYITEMLKQLTFINTSFMIILSKMKVDDRELVPLREITEAPLSVASEVSPTQMDALDDEIRTIVDKDIEENKTDLQEVVSENAEDKETGNIFERKLNDLVKTLTEAFLPNNKKGGKQKARQVTRRTRTSRISRKTKIHRKTQKNYI